MKRLLPLLLLSACTLASEPVKDWPQLKQEVTYVDDATIPCRNPYARGCAIPRFKYGTCSIYIDKRYAGVISIESEEKKHCEGYDHVGEHQLSDMLHGYRVKEPMRREP